RKCIGLDLDGVAGVGSREADPALAFRPHETAQQCPGSHGWIEPGRRFGAANWYLYLACLQIRSVESGIALPKEGCLSAVVAGSKRLLVFPSTADTEMVLEILPYTRKVLDNRDPQGLQMGVISDTRQHQYFRRMDRAERQNDFVSGIDSLGFPV